MLSFDSICGLARVKGVLYGYRTKPDTEVIMLQGNPEQIVGFAVRLTQQHCDENGVTIRPKNTNYPEADKLPVVAHLDHVPYHKDSPVEARHVAVMGAGPDKADQLVRLSDVRAMVHDLEHAKAKQDAVLGDTMVLLGLPLKSDWGKISEKLVELINRPSLKVESTNQQGTTFTINATLTPPTVEAFKVQWPADAPVADAIDWKG